MATYEEITADIDALFDIFDRIEWLQFVGGEVFLHKDMHRIYRYCERYKDNFDQLIVETNATIPLDTDTTTALAKYGVRAKLMISDYGILSPQKAEYVKIAEQIGIICIVKNYHDGDQHFGGWIDNTEMRDYNESPEEVARLSAGCPQVRLGNMHCFKGQLHRCSNSLFMAELGILKPGVRDCLNVNDTTLSISDKRQIIENFYTAPRVSCRYCTWKNADTLPRFPAAEQI